MHTKFKKEVSTHLKSLTEGIFIIITPYPPHRCLRTHEWNSQHEPQSDLMALKAPRCCQFEYDKNVQRSGEQVSGGRSHLARKYNEMKWEWETHSPDKQMETKNADALIKSVSRRLGAMASLQPIRILQTKTLFLCTS